MQLSSHRKMQYLCVGKDLSISRLTTIQVLSKCSAQCVKHEPHLWHRLTLTRIGLCVVVDQLKELQMDSEFENTNCDKCRTWYGVLDCYSVSQSASAWASQIACRTNISIRGKLTRMFVLYNISASSNSDGSDELTWYFKTLKSALSKYFGISKNVV